MHDEIASLIENQTWDLVELPQSKRALHNKWVYLLKEENNGTRRYKVTLVVKGLQEREDIDFNEIFSAVVKHSTIRSVLSIVVAENLHLEQLDVKTRFSMAIWRTFTCCSHMSISCLRRSSWFAS